MGKMFVILAFLCLFVISCSGSGGETVSGEVDCSSSGYNAIAEAELDEWEEIITVTLTRFPGNLSPIIRDLENKLGDYKNMAIPDCYHPAHDKFVAGMEYALEGVKEFDTTGNVSDKFNLAEAEFTAAQDELAKLDQ